MGLLKKAEGFNKRNAYLKEMAKEKERSGSGNYRSGGLLQTMTPIRQQGQSGQKVLSEAAEQGWNEDIERISGEWGADRYAKEHNPQENKTSEQTKAEGEVLTPVRSSNVKAVGWWGSKVVVEFLNGSLYEYQASDAARAQALWKGAVTASSVGMYVNKNIKVLSFTKVG